MWALLLAVVLSSGSLAHSQTHLNGERFLYYDVTSDTSFGQISAQGVLSWQPNSTGYRSELTIKALFLTLLKSQSEGRVGAILTPQKYTEKLFRRDPEELKFNRQANRIDFSSGAASQLMRPNEQDNLSLIWQLRAQVAGRGAAEGPHDEFFMSGPTDIFELQFKGLGRENVRAMGRTFSAWHVQRLPLAHPQKAAQRKQFDFWFAPELDYLPIKIQYKEQDGQTLDFVLTKVGLSADD